MFDNTRGQIHTCKTERERVDDGSDDVTVMPIRCVFLCGSEREEKEYVSLMLANAKKKSGGGCLSVCLCMCLYNSVCLSESVFMNL
jgi:hypothetical protein